MSLSTTLLSTSTSLIIIRIIPMVVPVLLLTLGTSKN